MQKKQEIETNNILKEIIEKCKKSIDSHYKNSITSSEIEVQKAQAMDMTVTLISASLSGVASGIGLVFYNNDNCNCIIIFWSNWNSCWRRNRWINSRIWIFL